MTFFYQLQPWKQEVVEQKILQGDAIYYHQRAVRILETASLSWFPPVRPPGYNLFIVFFYYLFGVHIWVVLLVQCLLDTGITIMTYFLSWMLFKSKSVSLVAAILYATNWLTPLYSITLLSDIPCTFIFVLSIIFFVNAMQQDKISYIILSAFLLGIATFIRPIFQYFIVILIFMLLLRKQSFSRKLINITAIFLIFAAVLSPWQFRNLVKFGQYSLTTTFNGTLCYWVTATLKAEVENKSFEQARLELLVASAGEKTTIEEQKELWEQGSTELWSQERIALAGKIAKEYIRKHPKRFLILHLKGMIIYFMGVGEGGVRQLLRLHKIEYDEIPSLGITGRIRKLFSDSREEYYLIPILLLIVIIEYIFMTIGAAIMWIKKLQRPYLVLLALTALYSPLITGSNCEARYRVPIVALYLVVTAFGIVTLFSYIKKVC
jgi:4-amino-4-deoxy-L-arabinose transferase-like glycosyltransferase